jgi:hypothetical protein
MGGSDRHEIARQGAMWMEPIKTLFRGWGVRMLQDIYHTNEADEAMWMEPIKTLRGCSQTVTR